MDCYYGYRYNIIVRHFRDFLEKLKNAGVKMIFTDDKTFLKVETKRQVTELFQRIDDRYEEICAITDKMKEIKNVSELHAALTYELCDEKKYGYNFPLNCVFYKFLMDVAKEYGEVVGISKPKMHFTLRDEAQIADERNVFAILGQDSHYLLHGGNWKYWCIDDLCFNDMTILEFDRDVVVNYLGLDRNQMFIFYTLTGSSLLPECHKTVSYLLITKMSIQLLI